MGPSTLTPPCLEFPDLDAAWRMFIDYTETRGAPRGQVAFQDPNAVDRTRVISVVNHLPSRFESL